MWIKFLLVLSLFHIAALAEPNLETESRIESNMEAVTNDAKMKSPLEMDFTLDIKSGKSRMNRAETNSNSGVRELSFGMRYKTRKELSVYVEGSAEEFNGESEFYFKEAYVDLDLRSQFFSAQVGQQYYPVGFLSKEDKYFLNQPLYYSELFKGDRAIDLGLRFQVYPFKSEILSLEASCFEGRVFRVNDQRQESAERKPCAFGLRSKFKASEVYFTHFTHDLAFYDPVLANGAGFKTKTPRWIEGLDLSSGLWGEYWSIETSQFRGPKNLTQAGFLYPHIDIWRLRFGYRHSHSTAKVSYSNIGEVRSNFQDELWRVEFKIFEPLTLIYEDQRVQQKDGPQLRDEWATRLLLELSSLDL